MNNQVRDLPGSMLRGSSRPTMKDVASRAGVALKTVSRVVNGEPGVTPATATRVRHAIEDLGFRRNESARLLRTGGGSALGFIADDFADAEVATACRGIEDVAREHGMLLLVGSTDCDPDREQRLALSLTARRVDGLIIVPTPGEHSYLVSEINAGTAAVFMLRQPADVDADAVLADERGGARAAAAHLIAHGHRRIGYLGGGLAQYRTRQHLQGYAEAMAEAGLVVADSWTGLTPQRLLDSTVTAVFCGSREHTALALRTLAAAGRPDRMAVIGFGDFALADRVRPGLSAVTYDPAELGRAAAKLLFRRIAGESGPARRVEIPTRLIARGSAELPPPAD